MKNHWKAIFIFLTPVTLLIVFFVTSTIIKEQKEQAVVEVRPDSTIVDLKESEKLVVETEQEVSDAERNFKIPVMNTDRVYLFKDGRMGVLFGAYHFYNEDADIIITRVVDGWLTDTREDAWSADTLGSSPRHLISYDMREYEEQHPQLEGLDSLRAHWPTDLVPKTMRHPLFGDIEPVMDATLTAAKGPRPIAFSTDVMRVARKLLKVEDEKLVSNFKRFRTIYILMGRPEWVSKKISHQVDYVDRKIGTADLYQTVIDGSTKVWAFTKDSGAIFYLPYSELVMRRARPDNLIRWEKIKLLLNEGLLADSKPDWDALLVKVQAIKSAPTRRGKLIPMKG